MTDPAAPAQHAVRTAAFDPVPADRITVVRAGVGVIVPDAEGRVLLERRSDCGRWGLIGGRIDPGETIEQTVRRETLEETGLTVEPVRLLGIYSDPRERVVTYPDNVVQLIDIVLVVRIVSGTLRISPESEDLRFFAAGSLPTDVVPPARRPLEDFFAGRTGVFG